VYSVTLSGTETVLHSFKGATDGAIPEARMIVRNGTLYGATSMRGGGCHNHTDGCGTVFSITPSGHETVLYRFAGSPDGQGPLARLLNVNGTLYGTTLWGGSSCLSYNTPGCGTVFSITPGGKEKVVYSFQGSNDGFYPQAGLVDVKGTLYGTTQFGGANKGGTVFSITPGGKENVLYSFGASGNDGVRPLAGLIDVSGTLYGTTYTGGDRGCNPSAGCGTVFSITPSGKETVLYSFVGGADGANPSATLLNVNGTLYGTTVADGAYGYGTVFSITLSGHETVLYSFKGYPGGKDGDTPSSGLSNVNGTFYGATEYGGAYNSGTVYSITP
jgi:uncharacterized repeat protein (TIGR03803 family)